MEKEKIAAYKPVVRELASRIYVRMVGDVVKLDSGSPKMAVSAENIAKLSFKLAEAFQSVEDELNADNMPKNVGFKLDTDDIASWGKK